MAKGKGDMQTYWVEANSGDGKSVVTLSTNYSDDNDTSPEGRVSL